MLGYICNKIVMSRTHIKGFGYSNIDYYCFIKVFCYYMSNYRQIPSLHQNTFEQKPHSKFES